MVWHCVGGGLPLYVVGGCTGFGWLYSACEWVFLFVEVHANLCVVWCLDILQFAISWIHHHCCCCMHYIVECQWSVCLVVMTSQLCCGLLLVFFQRYVQVHLEQLIFVWFVWHLWVQWATICYNQWHSVWFILKPYGLAFFKCMPRSNTSCSIT